MHGQLGLRSADDKLVPTHAVLLDGYHVSLVAAGYGHSAVLTAEARNTQSEAECAEIANFQFPHAHITHRAKC